jgi:SAM-dependent methyltransferase
MHVFGAICEPFEDDRIYLTEAVSPVFQKLARRYPLLRASEYLPDFEFGGKVESNRFLVRNEDVTNLSYEDSSFDTVLTFDVLEHVPDYRSALKEFYRVLAKGGQLVVSVPFSFEHETRVRARVDESGNIEHLEEPCYHGDPLSDKGVLSYYDFGMELLDEIKKAGFEECFLACYYSRDWGYLNRNVIFIARKLKTGVSRAAAGRMVLQKTAYWANVVLRGVLSQAKSKLIPAIKPGSKEIQQSPEYLGKLQIEKEFFGENTVVHDLPDIFHYWSNGFLGPEMNRFGFGNPEEFFVENIKRFARATVGKKINILSIGSGNCDLELSIGEKLLGWGFKNFDIECLEINQDMLSRARAAAAKAEMSDYFIFSRVDFNHWQPQRAYSIILANQSLHHVLNLEGLFDSVLESLATDGVFLVSDMIGRNGHMRWPEALKELQPFWDELPGDYRYNRLLNRHEEQFINHDCSLEGFEGIRAQDILPLLMERFHFDFFFPFGNIIFVFVDRSFGHNFDAKSEWDRDFIDRVQARDEAAIISGELTPTSMLAVLSKRESETILRHPALTPGHCVRDTTAEPDNQEPTDG